MDRARIEAKRDEVLKQLDEEKATVQACLGALQVLEQLLEEDQIAERARAAQTDGSGSTPETAAASTT